MRIRVSLPFSGGFPSAKLFVLLILSSVLSGLVPVGAFALRTNSRLTIGAKSWHPFVRATATSVALLLDRDHRHGVSNILAEDTLSSSS